MGTTFKAAFFASLMIHSAIIMPTINLSPNKKIAYEKKQMEVDYVITQELRDATEKDDTQHAVTDTSKTVAERKIEIKPVPLSEVNYSKKTADSNKSPAKNIIKKIAKIRSTKEYMSYYQLIREKIRHRLKANYTSNCNTGDVRIIFTLNSDGSLVSVTVDDSRSTGDANLAGVACASIREAAPFPAFPKVISLPKMAFNLIVSFKKQ